MFLIIFPHFNLPPSHFCCFEQLVWLKSGKTCRHGVHLCKALLCFQALQNDIELRKKNVDQAIANGMELLKQTTGMSPFTVKIIFFLPLMHNIKFHTLLSNSLFYMLGVNAKNFTFLNKLNLTYFLSSW